MTTNSSFFDAHIAMIYSNLMDQYMPEYFKSFEYTPWVFSLLGSVVIGLSGIFPLIIIPTEEKMAKEGYKDRKSHAYEKYINWTWITSHPTAADSKLLRVLLSFAVGGLLGDVFLHLLPEAWEGDNQGELRGNPSCKIISIILVFLLKILLVTHPCARAFGYFPAYWSSRSWRKSFPDMPARTRRTLSPNAWR